MSKKITSPATTEEILKLSAGDMVELSGILLTGRRPIKDGICIRVFPCLSILRIKAYTIPAPALPRRAESSAPADLPPVSGWTAILRFSWTWA